MRDRLRVERLTKRFGGLVVASDISFSLRPGERTALIGPNGAGKTTLVNLISGALLPTSGAIYLDGAPIASLGAAARARAGIVRTFQIGRLCRTLSVVENVQLPLIQRRRAGFRFWPSPGLARSMEDEAALILRQLGIEHLSGTRADRLAYGQQRLVEIGIALAMEPRLLLLDEPAAGLPESESRVVLDVVDGLPSDLPILLIEHDMDLVFRFARRVIVLVNGAILMDGSPAEVAADRRVRDTYFGSAA